MSHIAELIRFMKDPDRKRAEWLLHDIHADLIDRYFDIQTGQLSIAQNTKVFFELHHLFRSVDFQIIRGIVGSNLAGSFSTPAFPVLGRYTLSVLANPKDLLRHPTNVAMYYFPNSYRYRGGSDSLPTEWKDINPHERENVYDEPGTLSVFAPVILHNLIYQAPHLVNPEDWMPIGTNFLGLLVPDSTGGRCFGDFARFGVVNGSPSTSSIFAPFEIAEDTKIGVELMYAEDSTEPLTAAAQLFTQYAAIRVLSPDNSAGLPPGNSPKRIIKPAAG